jgi:energy-coupling factor transporter ATP-binding protein EcfA2
VITNLSIRNFKSLQAVDLRLGRFNLFVGANASGKSNFFDSLRVLQGIGYGFTVDEIFNGKPKSATAEVWDGIRGGSNLAHFLRRDTADVNGGKSLIEFAVAIEDEDAAGKALNYSISLEARSGLVRRERFAIGPIEVFNSNPVGKSLGNPDLNVHLRSGYQGKPKKVRCSGTLPVLQQLSPGRYCGDYEAEGILLCARHLRDVQRIDPWPAALREYSQAHHVGRMGEHGENFAALIKSLSADPGGRSAYLSWLQQLVPTEVDDVDVIKGPLGESMFALKEGKNRLPAPILSDGTLRFAALTAAFFQPDMPRLLLMEEIENGIHASRLRLLVELLKTQSARTKTQVMVTTHSPLVLAWLDEEDYQTTFLCRRDEETGASRIVPVSEIPDFLELARKYPMGDLFARNWLEAAT